MSRVAFKILDFNIYWYSIFILIGVLFASIGDLIITNNAEYEPVSNTIRRVWYNGKNIYYYKII